MSLNLAVDHAVAVPVGDHQAHLVARQAPSFGRFACLQILRQFEVQGVEGDAPWALPQMVAWRTPGSCDLVSVSVNYRSSSLGLISFASGGG